MRYSFLLLLCLTACFDTTPVTILENGPNVVTCGGGTQGSAIAGRIGYNIQKSHDQECVEEYTMHGYKIVGM